MSEDLIRRSDAIDAIENTDWYHQNKNKDMVSGANSDEHQAWYKADDVYKALEAIPTIEPKRGEWKEWIDCEGEVFWKCSACGQASEASAAGILYKFCPFCGADMRGKDDDNN